VPTSGSRQKGQGSVAGGSAGSAAAPAGLVALPVRELSTGSAAALAGLVELPVRELGLAGWVAATAAVAAAEGVSSSAPDILKKSASCGRDKMMTPDKGRSL
jgi:hypothetical protein